MQTIMDNSAASDYGTSSAVVPLWTALTQDLTPGPLPLEGNVEFTRSFPEEVSDVVISLEFSEQELH